MSLSFGTVEAEVVADEVGGEQLEQLRAFEPDVEDLGLSVVDQSAGPALALVPWPCSLER